MNDQLSEAAGLSRRGILRGAAYGSLALGGASVLAACSTSGGKSDAGAAASPQVAANAQDRTDLSGLSGKTIGLVGVALTSESVKRIADEAKRLSKEFGFTLDAVDTNGDYKKASDTLKIFADKKYDAVISAVVDPHLMEDGSNALADAGIPFGGCFAGNGPGLAFDVTSDEWLSAGKVGTYLIQRLQDQGRKGGVAIINYTPIPATLIRERQFTAMVNHYEYPVLDRVEVKVPGQVVDTERIVTDLLTKYPKGGELLAVIGGWDEVGLAASNAIKKAGRTGDVFSVSVDGNLGNFDAIRNGEPFAATACNDMQTITAVCLNELMTIIEGGSPTATTIYVDAAFVSDANVPPPGEFPVGAGLTPFFVNA